MALYGSYVPLWNVGPGQAPILGREGYTMRRKFQVIAEYEEVTNSGLFPTFALLLRKIASAFVELIAPDQ